MRSVGIFQILASDFHDDASIDCSISYSDDWSRLFSGKMVEEHDYYVLWTRIMLQIVFKVAKRIPPPDFASIESFNDEILCAFISSADNHLMASLRSEYYGSVSALLWPYLKILKILDRIEVSEKELSKGQQDILHFIYHWERYTLYNITAFDCVGAVNGHVYRTFRGTSSSLVIMGNPVNTLHILLQLLDKDMNYLYQYTVDKLSRFRLASQILNQDLEFLRMPWSQISPTFQLHLATTLVV
ncbi:hypothetical protein COCVIDRAFT_40759 [Bipolaris victoriae FI3]|uniref:Uncharacterized protein n=1 Tax=Bipolaris victoriae (strain FI3) TaxID=930091 RepID=W7E996_BIPV3|nr:hypothetical protein COCVIDRAFT_40759 [Bipolaris victoriae FI3]